MVETLLQFRVADGPNLRLAAAMVFAFAAVFLMVFGTSKYISTRNTMKRRLILNAGLVAPGADVDQDWFKNNRSLRYQSLLTTSALLRDVEQAVPKGASEASRVRRDLVRAGFFGPQSVYWYQLSRALLLIICVFGGYVAYSQVFASSTGNGKLLAAIFAGGIGFLLPSRFIAARQSRIVQECREGFPDFIDLLIICAEAGLGPRASIERLSREIAKAHTYLGAHLYLASLEVRAGNSLHESLFNLSRRTQVEEAASLASLLEQTEQLGTSITDALRVYSDEMRDRRLMRAEEKAHALPAKLVLPLGLFVFPVILIVILLPVVVRMKSAAF